MRHTAPDFVTGLCHGAGICQRPFRFVFGFIYESSHWLVVMMVNITYLRHAVLAGLLGNVALSGRYTEALMDQQQFQQAACISAGLFCALSIPHITAAMSGNSVSLRHWIQTMFRHCSGGT